MKKALVLLLALALLSPFCATAGNPVSSLASTSLTGAEAAKRHNLQLAASRINGTVLPRGRVFSFNDIVGPRTRKTGYLMHSNGMGIQVFGGGVSQLATTLDMALAGFDNNIQFLERHTYDELFTDHYVPTGKQAVRVEYSGGKNYAFTDNMQSIQIDAWVEGDELFCLVKGAGDFPYDPPKSEPLPPGLPDPVISTTDLIASGDLEYRVSGGVFEIQHGERIASNNKDRGDAGFLSSLFLPKGQRARIEVKAIVKKGVAFGIILAEKNPQDPFNTGWICVNADLNSQTSRLFAYHGPAAPVLGDGKASFLDNGMGTGKPITLAMEILEDGTFLASYNGEEYTQGKMTYPHFQGGYPGIMTFFSDVEFESVLLTRYHP